MTGEDRNLLLRIGLVNQKRPLPPQSVRFDGDTIRWDEPGETANITHYLVRVGSDTATVRYKVPVGTTAIRPGSGDSDFFLSSWNETMRSESQRVALPGGVTGGSGVPPGHVTDVALSIVGQSWIRGQHYTRFSVSATSPVAGEFNGFDGVYVHHFGPGFETQLEEYRTETPWLPVEVEPATSFTVEFSVLTPYDKGTHSILVVARGADATADYATAPSVSILNVPGQRSEEVGDVQVVPPLTSVWQASGDLRLHALRADEAGYIPPYLSSGVDGIGDFIGVALYWAADTEPDSPYSAGFAPYTGVPASPDPANYGEVDVVIPRGKIPAAGTYYLVLRPYTKSQFPVWKPHYRVPEDSYFTVTITAQDLTDNPSDGTTPTGPTGVTPVVTPGPTDDTYYPGVRFTPASSLGSTVGYAHAYRFWADSGKTSLWYPTDGTWIDAGDKLGANLSEIRADLAQRDSLTVYMEARVAPINERYERGSWVVSSGTAPVYPPSANTPGSAASVAITVGDGTDSRSYVVNSTLTPPSPLGPAVAWEAWLALYYEETDVEPYLLNQVHDWIDISDTSEPFGPYPRAAAYEPWAELRVRLIYSHGAKSDWIVSSRAQVTRQVAPPVTITNESSIRDPDDFRTHNGLPEYRVHQKITLSGDKDACDWIYTRIEFSKFAGGSPLDGWTEPGGVDPLLNDAWPVTQEVDTNWATKPDYDFWYRVGAWAVNSDGVPSSIVWTTWTKVNKSAGFDAGGMDPNKLGTRLLIDGDGKLTAYALTELAKWGLSAADFDGSTPGSLKLNNAVISRLLTQTITLTGAMYVLASTGTTGVRINSDGVLVGNSSQYVDVTSTGVAIKGGGSENKLTSAGMEILVGGASKVKVESGGIYIDGGLQVNGSGSAIYFEVLTSRIDCNVLLKANSGFEHVAGSVTIASGAKSDWRTALGLVIGTDVAAQSHNHDSAYAAASHTHSWSSITDKPSTFTPASHTHTFSDVGGGTLKFPETYSEAIALSGITTTGWVPCYDSSGNYIGKIPVFT